MAQHSPVQRRLAAEAYESWLDEIDKDRCPECTCSMVVTPTRFGCRVECEGCSYWIEWDYDPDSDFDIRVRT